MKTEQKPNSDTLSDESAEHQIKSIVGRLEFIHEHFIEHTEQTFRAAIEIITIDIAKVFSYYVSRAKVLSKLENTKKYEYEEENRPYLAKEAMRQTMNDLAKKNARLQALLDAVADSLIKEEY